MAGFFQQFARQHKQAFSTGLNHLVLHPTTTWLTVLAIATAMSLPISLNLFLQNLKSLNDNHQDIPTVSVFIKQGVSLQQAQDRASLIKEMDEVQNVEVISKEDAFNNFKNISGFAETLETLDENPLPHVLVITPKLSVIEHNSIDIQTLAIMLERLPEVDLVQMDVNWVNRLRGIFKIADRVILVISVMLSMTVLLVIGNTIKLNIESRREEIEVTRLIGATRAYIRRPMLYTGLFYGTLGGVMSLVLVHVALLFLIQPVTDLSELYNSQFQISSVTAENAFWVIIISSCVGVWGAWLAFVRQYRRFHVY